MASVVMYVHCIGTYCMTCFITFDDLSSSSNSCSSIFFNVLIRSKRVRITIVVASLQAARKVCL